MKYLLIILMSGIAFHANALVYPTKQNNDSRIVSAKYDPTDVIEIRTQVGVATLIQLEQGETILSDFAGLAMGDAQAWGFNVRGNNIFFKPKVQQPNTNLTIVSDLGRTYAFRLVRSKYPYYVVKMDYKTAEDLAPKQYVPPCTNGTISWEGFAKWGDDELSPSRAWSDNKFTCFQFDNDELPVVYQIGSDGKEALVNYHIVKNIIVIHSVAKEYRLRLGEKVLGVYNSLATPTGYNDKATSDQGTRIIKD